MRHEKEKLAAMVFVVLLYGLTTWKAEFGFLVVLVFLFLAVISE